jgi:hypothetical protein
MAITLASDDHVDWIDAVTSDDLERYGHSVNVGETPPQALQRLAEELDVDLTGVGRCLALLSTGRVMISGGSPIGFLAFSPRRCVFRASFDGDYDDDQSSLSVAGAGVWLTLFAAENGPLPDSEHHWLMTRFTDGGVVAANTHLLNVARVYAGQGLAPSAGIPAPLDAYNALIGKAFWQCATHCLR